MIGGARYEPGRRNPAGFPGARASFRLVREGVAWVWTEEFAGAREIGLKNVEIMGLSCVRSMRKRRVMRSWRSRAGARTERSRIVMMANFQPTFLADVSRILRRFLIGSNDLTTDARPRRDSAWG